MTESLFTIFLVDDDAGVLKALSRLLRARGYDIKVFTSPQAFLTDHDASIPGCAVLDVSMPGLDGLELQQALTAGGSAAGHFPHRQGRHPDQRPRHARRRDRFSDQAC